MIGPLYKILGWSHGTLMLLALIIGFFFGYALYRSGFYSSKKLAGVFYLYDFAVYKVIFGGIVAAGFLIWLSSTIGILKFDMLTFHPSYLLSSLLGGFLFGIGFIFGGFCPGTSIVSAVSGSFDAMAFIVGIYIGIGIWDLGYSWLFKGLNHLGGIKEKTLMDLWNIPYIVLIIIALVIVIITFPIVMKVEKKFQEKNNEE